MRASDFEALLHMLASLFALGQVVYMVPKRATASRILWLPMLLPLAPYLMNAISTKVAQSSIPLSFSHGHGHPAEALARNADTRFEALLQRQSRNYSAARDEYQRRYGIEPPPGFKSWYAFAASKQSPIIDDFGSISHSISPFWAMSGKRIVETMNEAYAALVSELWLCSLSGSSGKTTCRHPHRTYDRHITTLFDELFADLHGLVNFLVNHLDEPRVLIPPQMPRKGSMDGTPFNLTDMSNSRVWNVITKYAFWTKPTEHASTTLWTHLGYLS